MKQINQKWLDKIKGIVNEAQNKNEKPQINEIIQTNYVSKWLIAYLASKNISFKVINLGAGVKRITTDTNICPKCNGTGRC